MTQYLGTHITKMDASPIDRVESRLHGGIKKHARDLFEIADTAANDYYLLFKISVDAVISSLRMACDDIGTAGTASFGFYKKNADGTYTAVDVDAIASAIDIHSGAIALTEQRYEAAAIDTALYPAWQLAGLSARPAYGDLYVALTTETGTDATGTVMVEMDWID